MNQDIQQLIKKYTSRLETMKQNRANEGDTWSEDTTREVDARIRELAEFISDLKSIWI